jgi:Rrf2 family transcriptional repressor of oqxAB
MLDLRFPTAVQMMLSLALAKEEGIERLSSTRLAQSLNANPSLVRTLLFRLFRTDTWLPARGETAESGSPNLRS